MLISAGTIRIFYTSSHQPFTTLSHCSSELDNLRYDFRRLNGGRNFILFVIPFFDL